MEETEIIESTVEQLMETVERYYDNEEEQRADIAQVLSSFADKITQNKDMEVFPAKQGGRMTPIEGKIVLAARKYALANNTEYGQIIEDMVLNAFRYTYKEYIKQYEEIKILKSSEQAAIAQQKKVFQEHQDIINNLQSVVESRNKTIEEMDKQIQFLTANCETHKGNLAKLLQAEEEISRLKGKIKESEEQNDLLKIQLKHAENKAPF